MIQLPVTKNGNSKFRISISGTVYTIKYKYNTRNQRLYLSIYLEDEPIILGLRLLELGAPLANYPITELDGKQIIISPVLEGTGFATLGNTGIGLEFAVYLLTPEDIEEIYGDV